MPKPVTTTRSGGRAVVVVSVVRLTFISRAKTPVSGASPSGSNKACVPFNALIGLVISHTEDVIA